MSDLEGLKKQRSVYRGILTKLLKFANGITLKSDETIEEMRLKANRAKEVLDKIDTVEASIFAIDSQEESKMGDAEECCYDVVTKLNNWIKKRGIMESATAHGDTSLNMTTIGSAPEVRLAKLQIPTFAGNYTEWQSFFDLFHSSIHSRESITPVQKFQYLKGLLKGDAFSLVKHFKVTESNYIEALRKLTQRYDRKRHTINAFIRSYVEQPTIHVASASNIRKLLDTSDEVIRGLKALGDQAESRDPWLIYLLQEKLDDETRSLWAQESTINEFPTIQEFFEFLIKRTDALESIRAHSTKVTTTSIKAKRSFAVTTDPNCIACNKGQHRLVDCDRFKGLSIEDRRSLIGSKRRCFNCLNPGHSVYDCKIRGRCRHCSRKHHTLVHIDATSNALASIDSSSCNNEDKTVAAIHTCLDDQRYTSQNICLKTTMQTILPTAQIQVFDNFGVPRSCRALLDTASQATFITEAFAQKLGLPRRNCRNLIAGIGQTSSGRSHGIITCKLTSRFDTVQLASLKALIITKITSSLPTFEFDTSCMKNLENISLADPDFYKPAPIDILLGADIVFELLEGDVSRISPSNLIAHKSKLGWIIGGTHEAESTNLAQSFTTIIDIDATLRKFWEIEEIIKNPEISKFTQEEQDCEDWFKATTKRAPDGRFVTKLPFKESPKIVGSTYQQALSRLLAMERRFQGDQQFRQLYVEFLKEYQDLKHMKLFEATPAELQKAYILPHHGVLKNSSSTTKLRVVFDASAKSTMGTSLNQNLKVGPNIQSSLLEILMRFRQHHYVLVGDIEKMYRQVWVDEEDTKQQLILWRDQSHIIRPYSLKTVTYGMASASFMSTRCLKELAQLNEDKFPEASRAIEQDIYVDDLMTGASTLSDLTELKNHILRILSSGGFNLRKLSSNNQQIRDLLNQPSSNTIKIISEDPEPVKLLGIAWDASTDNCIFQVHLQPTETYTKRSFLSEASKIFDPLGLLSPITIKIKILFQSLWLQKIGWDEQLPTETKSSWIELRNSLCQAPELKIPRCITTSTDISIHGFCDASKWAYAAAVYARSSKNQKFATHLICAKTKVSPLKQISIPRLELMGAVLLTRLVKKVTETLSIHISSITLWTDSKIVLDWLSSPPRRWTTFVANRTSEIIETYKRDLWRHVPTRHNPADCATRGKPARELLTNALWWNGPAWLCNDQCWPDQPSIPETTEESKCEAHATISLQSYDGKQYDVMMILSSKYSSYFKLKRVLSYMFRFSKNSTSKRDKREREIGTLTPTELEEAHRKIVTYWQLIDFAEEYRCLQARKAIPVKSKLNLLNPFLDTAGVLRVGGRLEKSILPYDTIHPIILSSKSPIATSIMHDAHIHYHHPGPNLLLSLVRQEFWVIRGKDVAKNVFRKCIKCLRQRPKMMSQLMGHLPEDRVRYSVTFGAVGVDFCGPFKVHPVRRRGSIPVKAYLCIFVCFNTHAIHIEICMNLSTESFLGALRRFISRRGLCHTIYCDNATNFIGAKNYLQEIYNFLSNNNNEIISNLLKDKINWRFIPPAAPHQGGLWESAVKSTKVQITRTVGDAILTLEEFSTLTVQIEGILNSRPICSNQGDDPDFLTPAHFLIGRSIHQIPESVIGHRINSHSRWDIVNNIYKQFWKRWQQEYLTTLQCRSKWQTQQKNLQINDVVLIHDNNLPPAQWLMGRVTKVYPGDDGNVRVAEVNTKGGTFKRAIQRLCLLPLFESDDDSTRGVCPDSASINSPKIKSSN